MASLEVLTKPKAPTTEFSLRRDEVTALKKIAHELNRIANALEGKAAE